VKKLFNHITLRGEIQVLDLFSRPGGSSQEFQAGFYRGVMGKAADIYPLSQRLPTIMLDEAIDNFFQRNAVEWIIKLFFAHGFDFIFPARINFYQSVLTLSMLSGYSSDLVSASFPSQSGPDLHA